MKGKLEKITINGIEVKPQDDFNLDLILGEESVIDSFMKTGVNNYSATIRCQPVDMEAFNKFLDDLIEHERIIKQQELKEKLLKKWLIKLYNKEIDRLYTGKYTFMINWDEMKFIIIDNKIANEMDSFENKTEFMPIGDYHKANTTKELRSK